MDASHAVLLPYEITRLSNIKDDLTRFGSVLLPYEITRLSNSKRSIKFRPLFYYPMKLHDSQTQRFSEILGCGFITLWNYTTLKPAYNRPATVPGFITLWNYTTLKPVMDDAYLDL